MSETFPLPGSTSSLRSTADSSSLKRACDLCGLPAGKSPAELDIGGKSLRFCCTGCRAVYQILGQAPGGMGAGFRKNELFRACLAAGIVSQPQRDPNQDRTPAQSETGTHSPAPLPLVLKVEGMWCPACSWLIEEVLRKTKGIVTGKVYFLTDTAQIEYLPHVVSLEEILSRISRLGYRPIRFDEDTESGKAKKRIILRLGISGILTFNVMMVAFALYYGFFEDLTPQGIGYLSWPLLIMATPVLFYGGWPILQKGLAGLRYGAPSLESLIAIGALSAYGYSLLRMVQGSLHLYFDTAAMLITLVLLGRFIEAQAREKTSEGVIELGQIAQQKVRICDPSVCGSLPFPSGHGGGFGEKWIPAREAMPGTRFAVKTGERTPLDGLILQGTGDVDESILTGESRPVRKGPGDEVMAGSLLIDGEMILRATRVGKESSLGQTITLLQEALGQKNSLEVLADRVTRWFVPAVLTVALFTGFLLWVAGGSPDEALLRGLTVLVISCPCALGIASPLVKVAALVRGKSRGILIRDPSALEQARNINTMIFDKTGTLTEGRFALRQIIGGEGSEEDILRLLAAVEIHSAHLLAKAVVRRARERGVEVRPSSTFEEWEGMGARGCVQGREIVVGCRGLMERFSLRVPPHLDRQASVIGSSGRTVVMYGWEGTTQGIAVFGDSLRPGARELIRELRARGIETWLVSGDGGNTTEAIAKEAGIPHYRGQALPQEKVQIVKDLSERGRVVGMVGDGLNDAAALAQADVSFSLGAGPDLVRESSDLILVAAEPNRLLDALDLSALTHKVIRQNLFFSFFYNGLAIPLAIAGFLNPLIAVCAMFASSLTVIGNALRLSRDKP